MIRVRAALGGDVDLRHLAPEFGRVDAGLHLEFLDAVDRGQEGIRIEVDVLIDDPVERVLVVFAALTGDSEILRGSVATLPAGRAAAAAAGPVRAHVRAQRHEIDEVAAVERQLQDLLVLDDRADRGVRGVDHRRAAGDLDRHLDGSELQREIQTGRLLHLQLDSVADLALKTLQVHLDVVDTREQIGEARSCLTCWSAPRAPALVWVFVTVTLAPTRMPPLASVTCPAICPKVWANDGGGTATNRLRTSAQPSGRDMRSLLFCLRLRLREPAT